MAEALGTRLAALLTLRDDEDKFPLNNLPNDLLVSVFVTVDDLRWVRHTVPLVCKAWNELYRSQNASPLHETLEVVFQGEAAGSVVAARVWQAGRQLTAAERFAAMQTSLRPAAVHGSRVVSWAEMRAGSVRKLYFNGEYGGDLRDFSTRDIGRLVSAVGPSLTELLVTLAEQELRRFPDKKPFWSAVRNSVAPHGRLRKLDVKGIFAQEATEADLESLSQQLAGSLEKLVLNTTYFDSTNRSATRVSRMRRFPACLFALTELRILRLLGHSGIAAIPAQISSLKKLEDLNLCNCRLSSLPKELGELSALTNLSLSNNTGLGIAPEDEAFPAQLGKLRSLRELDLEGCNLRAVPAFVGELESLEVLDLSENNMHICTSLDLLVGRCPRLREVRLRKEEYTAPWTPKALAYLKGFKRKLLAANPDAKVVWEVEWRRVQ